MSYNTRNLKKDMSGKIPVPQYFNPEANNYEVLYGANGASRNIIYDKDGNPLFSAGNPARVSDETTQQKLDALQTELQAIKERLDEPMPTELTGSIVVLAKDDDVNTTTTITPGSSLTVLENNQARDNYKEIRYGVRFDVAAQGRVMIDFYARTDPAVTLGQSVVQFTTAASNGKLADVASPFYKVRIQNDGASDAALRNFVIVGVR